MTMNEDPNDEDLGRMAGNPKLAEAIKNNLIRLRDGASGPVFAEMAKELLDGRIALRDLGRTDAYGMELTAAFERYKRWEAEQDPVELRRMVEQTRVAMGDDRLGD
jgi:hypothetical protein